MNRPSTSCRQYIVILAAMSIAAKSEPKGCPLSAPPHLGVKWIYRKNEKVISHALGHGVGVHFSG
ncbi:hypothetical protein D4R89_10240 [bacterium]|nr:MAG: hypothetical protein D4R89_10240 [bacterium]